MSSFELLLDAMMRKPSPARDWSKLIDGKEKELADAETKFSEEVEKLQKTYEKLSKERDETKERINDDDFKFAKAVKKAAAKASATDEL